VVVYVSVDETVGRPLLERFEQEAGIPVAAKFDTEATKTTGLASLLRQERSRPRADLFWSSEVFATVQLAEDGVFAPNDGPALAEWPAAFRDPQRRWYGFAARARVIALSPSRVSREERPTTWTDLAKERWKGRVVMADPRFGTTRGHLGAMSVWWGDHVDAAYFDAWLEGLAENETRLLTTGNAGVVDAIIAGEADVGMTDTDDVWAAQARGGEVELVYPRHVRDPDAVGAGTLLIPNTVALVAGGPNPEGARILMEWLLSSTVEEALLRSDSRNIPLRPDRLPPEAQALVERALVDDPLQIEYGRVAAAMDRAVERALDMLGNQAAAPAGAPAP
jgi:iron(III) transport system substrate-binding protein